MLPGLTIKSIYAAFPDLGFDLKWRLAAISTVPKSTEMISGLAKPPCVVEGHTLSVS